MIFNYLCPPDDDPRWPEYPVPFFGLSRGVVQPMVTKVSGKNYVKTPTPGGRGRARRAARLLIAHRAPPTGSLFPVSCEGSAIPADGTMAGLSYGHKHRENFLKLPTSPYTCQRPPHSMICAYLDHRAEEVREGQAATAVSGMAVRVMTVHAAKGLDSVCSSVPRWPPARPEPHPSRLRHRLPPGRERRKGVSVPSTLS